MREIPNLLRQKRISILFTMILLSAGLSACKMTDTSSAGGYTRPESSGKETLPLSIVFEKDGTPVFLGRDGERLIAQPVSYPLPTERIYGIKSFDLIFLEGSCSVLIVVDGKSHIINETDDFLCGVNWD